MVGRLGRFALAASILGSAAWAVAADAAATPVGRKIDNFSLSDYRGKTHALADHQGKPVVVAFIGTECPLAKSYGPRLRELAAEFEKQGVVFLGIDSNQQDTLAEIGAYARGAEIAFPILKDNNNEIADRFGAVRTPEAFLLDKDHVIRYWGRIDDQYGFKTGAGYVRPKLNERSLANAITEVLAGKPVTNAVTKADGCFIGRVTKIKPHGEVTYSNQIARIMQNRCVECHRKGEVAPFTLTSFDDTVAWSETIREVVNEGRMPPWFADPRYGKFSNDCRMSDDEKQQIATWIDHGCPEGNPADLPEPRKFVEGWQIGEPDQIVYMRDKEYDVPAEGTVEYQFFTVDPGWTEDKWVQATECRPGNRAVVHHIIVFVQPKDGGDFGGRGGIGGYAPGMTPSINPPGTAVFVPAGSKLVFQLHYTTNGVAQSDRSMVGIRFADQKSVKKLVRGGMVGDVSFKIPPGESNFEVKARHLFLKDTLLVNLTPHMHLRGKDFKYEAEYPDGTREVLLDVPAYDFNWQIRYMYQEPKLMPKGTRLHCVAHFDNSADNPANPDPTKTVTFGDQTWEEMMFGFYTSIDPKQDLTAGGVASTLDKSEVNGFAGEGSVTAGDGGQKD